VSALTPVLWTRTKTLEKSEIIVCACACVLGEKCESERAESQLGAEQKTTTSSTSGIWWCE